MLKKEMKVGLEILSPGDFVWTIIKKYSGDYLLLRRKDDKKVCALSGGQFRYWKLNQKETKT